MTECNSGRFRTGSKTGRGRSESPKLNHTKEMYAARGNTPTMFQVGVALVGNNPKETEVKVTKWLKQGLAGVQPSGGITR